MLELNCSHFLLKLVSWAAPVKSIVGTRAVGAGFGNRRPGRAIMGGEATLGATAMRTAVFLWMAKTPAILALAWKGNVRPDSFHGTTNINTLREIMPLKKDFGNVNRVGSATTGR